MGRCCLLKTPELLRDIDVAGLTRPPCVGVARLPRVDVSAGEAHLSDVPRLRDDAALNVRACSGVSLATVGDGDNPIL